MYKIDINTLESTINEIKEKIELLEENQKQLQKDVLKISDNYEGADATIIISKYQKCVDNITIIIKNYQSYITYISNIINKSLDSFNMLKKNININ